MTLEQESLNNDNLKKYFEFQKSNLTNSGISMAKLPVRGEADIIYYNHINDSNNYQKSFGAVLQNYTELIAINNLLKDSRQELLLL